MPVNTPNYAEQASVYPGKYEPLPWKEKEMLDGINKRGARIAKPPIHIRELSDCYKVEMAAPGFRPDDFMIHANGRNLSIAAYNKSPACWENEPAPSHFKCAFISRQYTLPPDTDTNFVTAEYRNGVLHMFFYKTAFPGENQPGRIVVY